MTIVMEMSTDHDIQTTTLNAAWNPVTSRFTWNQIIAHGLHIAQGQRIVVIAHGNNTEIGDAKPTPHGANVDASTFLALIQGNMAQNAHPGEIFISTCGKDIAGFAAAVKLAAQHNAIWHNIRIHGHNTAKAGPVPPPNDLSWTTIF